MSFKSYKEVKQSQVPRDKATECFHCKSKQLNIIKDINPLSWECFNCGGIIQTDKGLIKPIFDVVEITPYKVPVIVLDFIHDTGFIQDYLEIGLTSYGLMLNSQGFYYTTMIRGYEGKKKTPNSYFYEVNEEGCGFLIVENNKENLDYIKKNNKKVKELKDMVEKVTPNWAMTVLDFLKNKDKVTPITLSNVISALGVKEKEEFLHKERTKHIIPTIKKNKKKGEVRNDIQN